MLLVAGTVNGEQAQTGTDQGALTITVAGLERAVGQVRIAVFDSEEAWLDTAAYSKVIDLENTECSWTLEGVPVGEYGVVVLHDLNSNGKNDRNLLGIPKEPYGFSNNARATFGPPKWSKAKLGVTAGSTEITIEVK